MIANFVASLLKWLQIILNEFKWLQLIYWTHKNSFGVILDHLELFKSWGNKIIYIINMQTPKSFFVGSLTQWLDSNLIKSKLKSNIKICLFFSCLPVYSNLFTSKHNIYRPYWKVYRLIFKVPNLIVEAVCCTNTHEWVHRQLPPVFCNYTGVQTIEINGNELLVWFIADKLVS